MKKKIRIITLMVLSKLNGKKLELGRQFKLGDQWSGGGQDEDTVGFQSFQQDRETNPAMWWQLARMSCYLLHRCDARNHWAYWADPSKRESNDRLIGWAAAMWNYESNKVVWADCSHSWLSALGFTQHMQGKPCSMQGIQNRSDKIDSQVQPQQR